MPQLRIQRAITGRENYVFETRDYNFTTGTFSSRKKLMVTLTLECGHTKNAARATAPASRTRCPQCEKAAVSSGPVSA